MFRLALALGMPVRELLSRIGSDELTEWMAFYQLEPFGDFRADFRSGVMAATFANAHRSKDAKAFTPEDFMPFMTDRVQSSSQHNTQTQMKTNITRFKALLAHKVKKRG